VKKLITVRQALEDPAWLGSMLGGASFAVMRALLIACMGEPLSADEMPIFTELTGRTVTPSRNVRCGKATIAAILIVKFWLPLVHA
jgi:hypothetical protein